MRILHVFKTYLPATIGGAEQMIYQLCRAGRAHGIEADVFSLSAHPYQGPRQFDEHQSYEARLDLEIEATGFSWSAIAQFRQLAKQYDIIHYHFPWPFGDLLHFLAMHGKPTVLTYHSDIVRQKYLLQLYRPLMWAFLHSMKRIVVTSPQYLASSEPLRPYQKKTSIIPIGLNRDYYPPLDPARTAHWRGQLPPRFFLFVGVLRYYKGLESLLQALQDTPYPLVVVGSGPMEQEWHALAKQRNLINVHFVGSVEDADKIALLSLCEALVFPSHLRAEAFGISLLEAAMMGKPMISCDIGTGTSYVNINHETGLVVPPNDPPALKEALATLWNNPALARTYGTAAQARFQQLFTADSMARQYRQIYQGLLNT